MDRLLGQAERMTPNLTAQQEWVLHLVGEELTTKEIAAELGVSPRTAKQSIDRLRQLFGNLPHKSELVAVARDYENGAS